MGINREVLAYITKNFGTLEPWNLGTIMTTKAKRDSPRIAYVFTYNNYTEEGETALKDWLPTNCKYAVYGHEVAPTTGTPHLQGYFSLKKKSRTGTLQKKFKSLKIDLSLIYAEGSAQQSRVYCTKEDPNGFFECGNLEEAAQGARTDLYVVAKKLETQTVDEVAVQHPDIYVRNHSGLEKMRNIYVKKTLVQNRDITVSVFYGDSGIGKSRKAYEQAERLGIGIYSLPEPNGNSLWFEQYDGEKGLLLDDFYGWVKPSNLFKILDRYKWIAPVKGKHAYAQWTHVWITSNLPPAEWYKPEALKGEKWRAFNRRLHNIYQWRYGPDMVDKIWTVMKEDKPMFPEDDATTEEDIPPAEPAQEDIPTAQPSVEEELEISIESDIGMDVEDIPDDVSVEEAQLLMGLKK